jgi:catechol 2,3-dioxygenase-like lactoylglutathione lyase family enzyme
VIERLDHVAIAVPDLEAQVGLLTGTLGFELLRQGTFIATGAPLAVLRDPGSGTKLELVQGEPGFLHLAFASDDVAADHERLVAAGLDGSRGIVRIEPAKAESSLLTAPAGLQVQVVRYDADSPDR